MAWDDTPPTAAELQPGPSWDERPPSAQELSTVAPGPETSPVTSVTTGLANLHGWGPRLAAASNTAMDAITGINGPLAGGSIQDLIDEYNEKHQALQKEFAKAAAANPKLSAASHLASDIGTMGLAGPAAVTTPGLGISGAITGLGESDLTKPTEALGNAAKGALTNIAFGKTAEAAAPYAGKVLAPVGNAIKSAGRGLANFAEDMAVKATGATAVQASKFAEGTGRELLDRGIVNFGSSPGDIAENANAAMEASSEGIGNTLNQLDEQGVTVDRKTVLNYIKDKIRKLSGDESQTALVNKLQKEAENIESQIPEAPSASELSTQRFMSSPNVPSKPTGFASDTPPGQLPSMQDLTYQPGGQLNQPAPLQPVPEGLSEIPISQSEVVKRGYQSKVNWKSPNPDVIENNANTIVSRAYRQAGEDAATEANPELAAQFKADKETYHTLEPVVAAAERRNLVLKQSPIGGLLDVATDIAGGAPAAVGRRVLAPRAASATAVSADKIADILKATPGAFGKFADVLQKAAVRGGAAIGATDYLLQQTNQDYRAQRNKAIGEEK